MFCHLPALAYNKSTSSKQNSTLAISLSKFSLVSEYMHKIFDVGLCERSNMSFTKEFSIHFVSDLHWETVSISRFEEFLLLKTLLIVVHFGVTADSRNRTRTLLSVSVCDSEILFRAVRQSTRPLLVQVGKSLIFIVICHNSNISDPQDSFLNHYLSYPLVAIRG